MAKKRSAGGIPPSRGERVFEGINLFILIILGALMLFPFLNLLAKSFSSTTAITTGQVLFLPVDFQLGTYKYVMNESQFWDSLKVSLIITIGGTAGSMLVSCLTAYPLSKTWLYGRKPLILFFVSDAVSFFEPAGEVVLQHDGHHDGSGAVFAGGLPARHL